MMMEGKNMTMAAKHPLKNGEYITRWENVIVTNGNNVVAHIGPNWNVKISLHNLKKVITSVEQSEFIAKIPDGSKVKMILHNLKTFQSNANFLIVCLSKYNKEILTESLPYGEGESVCIEDIVSATELACVYLHTANQYTMETDCEFEVELYVNEERWI